ncbi:hypothetical protein AB3Y40_16240 [Yoonia sp. R2331]|uniref:hypothetical protein n=1 Tax=Yoonia sp. R2331 TaxID=3237238 RepID=UPI0034E4A92F
MIAQRTQDQPAPRTKRLVDIEKSKYPSKATLALQKRPRRENAAQRARHFLRIEKGGEA